MTAMEARKRTAEGLAARLSLALPALADTLGRVEVTEIAWTRQIRCCDVGAVRVIEETLALWRATEAALRACLPARLHHPRHPVAALGLLLSGSPRSTPPRPESVTVLTA